MAINPDKVRQLLRPNPFAGDHGAEADALTALLSLNEPGEFFARLVDIFPSQRFFLKVHPHSHPGYTASGEIASHTSGDKEEQSFQGATHPLLGLTDRYGREISAVCAYSNIDVLQAEDPHARPAPTTGERLATYGLTHGGLVQVVLGNPSHPRAVVLTRAALAAIVTASPLILPWKDEEIREALGRVCDRARADLDASGGTVIHVWPPEDVRGDAARALLQRDVSAISAALAHDPILRSRLDLVEVRVVPGPLI